MRQGLRDDRRRRGNDGQVDAVGQRLHVRVAGEVGDAVVLRIDRIDATVELLVDQRAHRAAVQLLRIAGGAEHRDRARIEQRLQRPACGRRVRRRRLWLEAGLRARR